MNYKELPQHTKKRQLKNGATRYYCPICGKPIFDDLTALQKPVFYLFGQPVREMTHTEKNPHKQFIINGKSYGYTCDDCASNITE